MWPHLLQVRLGSKLQVCVQEEEENEFGEWLAVSTTKAQERNLDDTNIYGLGRQERKTGDQPPKLDFWAYDRLAIVSLGELLS